MTGEGVITGMRRRASRPGRSKTPSTPRFDAAEIVGQLVDAAGTDEEGDVNRIVSDVIVHDPELSRAMLGVVQAMRDAGALQEHEAWHLLYWITEQMSFAWSATDPEFTRLTSAMDAIEPSHGLSEDETFYVDDAPADWMALSKEWEHRLDTIWAEEFTRLGEAELARLVQTGALHEDPRLYEGRASLRASADEESGGIGAAYATSSWAGAPNAHHQRARSWSSPEGRRVGHQ